MVADDNFYRLTFVNHPGTPAARMKKVPSTTVKKRSRELTSVFESFNPYQGMEGRIERIWITEIATDGIHLVCKLFHPHTFLCMLGLCFYFLVFLLSGIEVNKDICPSGHFFGR